MPCPFHLPWLDHSNYTWRRLQIMKLLIMKFSPTFCHFIPLRSKYSQNPALKHLQSIFFPCQRPNFTSIENHGKIIVLYILILIF
jgi:hypothetical protein